MGDFEKAVSVMTELFGRDYQFALSTAKDNIPSSRVIDTFFDGESFYAVTSGRSQKAAEIAGNPHVSLCSRKMHSFSGLAYNIGHPLKPGNEEIRKRLTKAFESWYFLHTNEADENLCYLKICPDAGFFHKDGIGYRVNFTDRTVQTFPYVFDQILTDD